MIVRDAGPGASRPCFLVLSLHYDATMQVMMNIKPELAGPDLPSLLPLELFKALGDPNRLAILAGLATGGSAQTVSEVAARCPVDISVVSRHLKILKQGGVLDAEKRGKEVLYRVRVPYLVNLLRDLASALEVCCPDGVCTIQEGPSEQVS